MITTRPYITLATVLVVLVCLFFIHAKESQIENDKLNLAKFSERAQQPPLRSLPLPILYTNDFVQGIRYRKVILTGSFLPEHEIYLENRIAGDIPKPNTKKVTGFHIVMPFLLESGQIVWVNRGWIKRDTVNRLKIPDAPSTADKQTIKGYISSGQKSIFEMPSESSRIINGHVVALNFYLHDDKKELLTRNVYPFIITQTGSGSDNLVRPEEDFYYTPSYSFDLRTWWFTLIIALGFWVISGIVQTKRAVNRDRV